MNWNLENTKNYLREKGFQFKHTIGSITFQLHVFYKGPIRLEVWEDKDGTVHVVDANNKPVDLMKL